MMEAIIVRRRSRGIEAIILGTLQKEIFSMARRQKVASWAAISKIDLTPNERF